MDAHRPIIETAGLHKAFGRQRVLDGVSLSIRAGERVALLGQNGAGKTTLIRCLLGEYTYAGRLSVCGHVPRSQRVAVLRQVGYVPQHPPPLQLSVNELLWLYTGLHKGLADAAVMTVAERLGLDAGAVGGRVFARLSGGMQQKVLIALALAKRPPLLILDEPAANLDPEGREAFFRELAAVPADTAMLLISHRVEELAGLIGRVVEMDLGRVIDDHPVGIPVREAGGTGVPLADARRTGGGVR